MKVKCARIYNENLKQYQNVSSWLTLSKEYIVLEVRVQSEKSILYRLVGDNRDKSPALYDARQFEIISNKIPSNWRVFQTHEGIIYFGPKEWQEAGFWEDCYEHEPAALEVYKREAAIIWEEDIK